MTLFGLSPLDVGVVGAIALAFCVVGYHFHRRTSTTDEYLLAGRSCGGISIGMSLAAALIGGMTFLQLPSTSYYYGLKLLALPVAIWIAYPIASTCTLPLYHGLGLCSIFEYIEYRFDASTRVATLAVYLAWRLACLALLLAVPCQLLSYALDHAVPAWMLILFVGFTVTLYTSLGGMRAVIWTDVAQFTLMAIGVGLIVVTTISALDGGVLRVEQMADQLGRPSLPALRESWPEPWKFWSLLPGFVLVALFLVVGDQTLLQRCLSAASLKQARRSLLVAVSIVSLLLPVLAYGGLCLLAFYQDYPQSMRPKWVVNVDSNTRRSVTYPGTRSRPLLDDKGEPRKSLLTNAVAMDPTSGVPLIDWDSDRCDASTLPSQVAEGRILRPNSKEPFTDPSEITDSATGDPQIERLAMRWQGEIILHERAQQELVPRYLTRPLPPLATGLLAAAIFAAIASALDSALHATGTLVIVDLHQRLGLGRGLLARKRGKSPTDLNDRDEMSIVRPAIFALGATITLAALLLAQSRSACVFLCGTTVLASGPLLAVFVLGIFTRGATAFGAKFGLVIGLAVAVAIAASRANSSVLIDWPLDGLWTLGLSALATLLAGFVASLFVGRSLPNSELRGLVVGVGRLGNRESEPIEVITVREPDA